jgi:hypothetical protein
MTHCLVQSLSNEWYLINIYRVLWNMQKIHKEGRVGKQVTFLKNFCDYLQDTTSCDSQIL